MVVQGPHGALVVGRGRVQSHVGAQTDSQLPASGAIPKISPLLYLRAVGWPHLQAAGLGVVLYDFWLLPGRVLQQKPGRQAGREVGGLQQSFPIVATEALPDGKTGHLRLEDGEEVRGVLQQVGATLRPGGRLLLILCCVEVNKNINNHIKVMQYWV